MDNQRLLWLVLGLLVGGAVVYAFVMKAPAAVVPAEDGNGDGGSVVACTLDAKACPDGSYVGRVAPSCDFAPCPGM